MSASWDLLRCNPINVLLILIPVALWSGAHHASPSLTFASNFIALIPLAVLLSTVTEDLALRFGDVVGGLLSASFGNVVEIIVAITALRRGLFVIVSTSLLGSVLANLLLVLGASFVAGGLTYHALRYSTGALRVYASLLLLACLGFAAPTAYGATVLDHDFPLQTPPPELLRMSRAIAAALLVAYAAYMLFLNTHGDLFVAESEESGELSQLAEGDARAAEPAIVLETVAVAPAPASECDVGNEDPAQAPSSRPLQPPRHAIFSAAEEGSASVRRTASLLSGREESTAAGAGADQPSFSFFAAFLWLTGITALVAVCSDNLSGSIEAVSTRWTVSQAFLGFIVLPVAGNAVEHMTAVIVASKGKADLALAVALGSSIQIALFAIPLLVLTGAVIHQPFTLAFDPFSVTLVVLAVLHTNVSLDGRANWLLGVMLLISYTILATTFFFGRV